MPTDGTNWPAPDAATGVDWGIRYGSDASETAALLIAELAANAATHGRVPGRDFELRLTYAPGGPEGMRGPGAPGLLRIEVGDTRGERRPPEPGELETPPADSEGGRGLLLAEALADRWEVLDRVPRPGKTILAELDLPN